MCGISIFVTQNKSQFVKKNQKPIMKYRLLLFAALLLSGMGVGRAAVVSAETAKETADMLLSQRGGASFKGGDASVETVMKGDVPVYHIVRFEKGGWALISAEDTVDPLLGYSFDSEFQSKEQPAVIKDWLQEYTDQIEIVRKNPLAQRHYRWDGDIVTRAGENGVEPLVTVTWDQGVPYNSLCPKVEGGPGGRAYVGCVAVAMGQALSVVQYPLRGTGTKTYTSTVGGSLSVNFDEEPDYDWDAILSGANNYAEVARLLYHCGVLIDMEYGADGSGAITDNIPYYFKTFYGFPESCVCYNRDNYPGGDDAWHQLLQEELKRGRCVIYAGNEGGNVGHCFNLDGWNGDKSYHINWGWGGVNNGYYTLNNLGDGVQGSYPDNHRAVVGVAPKSATPYDIRLSTTRVKIGTPAGEAVADVTVYSDMPSDEYNFETKGPEAFPPGSGKFAEASYEVRDGKLYTTKLIEDKAAHKTVYIKAIHKESGNSYEKKFDLQLSTTGIDEVSAETVRVYPVPAVDVLNIETPDAAGEYAIYNLAGMLLQRGDISDNVTTVDVSSLAKGSYMLRYSAPQGVVTKSFIVK